MAATTSESSAFRAFLERLVTYKVQVWGQSYPDQAPPEDEDVMTETDEADVASSLLINSLATKHAVVLDIDHPAWLVKSTTPGHYHLYIDVPNGIEWEKYEAMLFAMAEAGVIEPGYHEVSKRRRRTDVRLPWVKKPVNPVQAS